MAENPSNLHPRQGKIRPDAYSRGHDQTGATSRALFRSIIREDDGITISSVRRPSTNTDFALSRHGRPRVCRIIPVTHNQNLRAIEQIEDLSKIERSPYTEIPAMENPVCGLHDFIPVGDQGPVHLADGLEGTSELLHGPKVTEMRVCGKESGHGSPSPSLTWAWLPP